MELFKKNTFHEISSKSHTYVPLSVSTMKTVKDYEYVKKYSDIKDPNMTNKNTINLDALLCLPNRGNGVYPLVITINSWGLSKLEYINQVNRFNMEGIAALCYSTRGFGKSEGATDGGGPADIYDLNTFIKFLKEFYGNVLLLDNIITLGISYGSTIGLIGSIYNKRICSSVVMSGWGRIYTEFNWQDSFNIFWASMLELLGHLTGNPSKETDQLYTNLYNHTNLEKTKEWSMLRSPLDMLEDFKKECSHKSVFFIKSEQDYLFKPNTTIELFNNLDCVKRLDILQGIHGITEAFALLIPWKYNYVSIYSYHIWDDVHSWIINIFNNNLPINNSINISTRNFVSKFTMKNMNKFEFKYKDYYLYGGVDKDASGILKYFKSLNFKGVISENDSGPETIELTDSTLSSLIGGIYTTGIPAVQSIVTSYLKIPVINIVNKILPIKSFFSVFYISESLEDGIYILGIPKISFSVKSNNKSYQIIVYLYDICGSIAKLITHGPYTQYDSSNEIENVDIDLVYTSYYIEKGHQLGIAMDTSDLLYMPIKKWLWSVDIMHTMEIKFCLPFHTFIKN